MDYMKGSNSTLFVPSPRSLNNVDDYRDGRKKSPAASLRLNNGLEGVKQSARRFHGDVVSLQRGTRRCDKLSAVAAVNSMIVMPEAPRMALMEVNEEEEEEGEVTERKVENEVVVEPSTTNTWLSREAFFERSREQLASPESRLAGISTSLSSSSTELASSLATALARNARLLEQRRAQIARYLQLQHQVDSLSAELDASVDNLRYQRTRWEAEKLRSTLESRELRQQLSEALAALQTVSRGSPHNTLATRHNGNEKSSEGCTRCEERNLEMSALQIAVERLESEMVRQRRGAEQEAAQWTVQLADAAAENRALRLQLSRSTTTVISAAAASAMKDNEMEGSCVNCRRLQQLVNVLQAKRVCDVPHGCDSDRTANAEVQTDSHCDDVPFQNDTEGISLFELLESGCQISQQQLSAPWKPQRTYNIPPPSPTQPPPTSDSPDATSTEVSRLRQRLSLLESEVESSADQLKASNDEFFQLRQHLTNATVEKAHLKATLDGLYDEMAQLKTSLHAKTRELGRCQVELTKYQVPKSCVVLMQEDSQPLIDSSLPNTTGLKRTFWACQKYATGIWPAAVKFARASNLPVRKWITCQAFKSRKVACVVLLLLCVYAFFLNFLLLSRLAQ